ncbi:MULTISPECIES: alpha/beta hydrolase fold domain-containing protein [unclassified Mesorhizobium]|uniref:alpha/beta hydrolase n=1 Tax=unclassified Mesorhizobium TaxID=325217 RepID=UPI0033384899
MTDSHAALDEPSRQLMMEIGPTWARDIQAHRDVVLRAYGPLLNAAPKAGVTVTRDIAYGPHARQVLDLFVPAGIADAPVVVFVHGGVFVRGDKRLSSEVNDNVLYWFARQGFIAINIEYRLAPESPWPGGADDLGLAIVWACANVRLHGGDPGSIFAIGHSAGSTHVGTYAYDPAAGYLGRGLTGIVLLSPRLRIDVSPENPFAESVRAYFGDDPSVYETRSPVTHAAVSALPVMIAIAEFEYPLLDVYGLELAYRIAVARRRVPRFMRLAGHNHISLVAHFNTVEDTLGREIVEFTRHPI